MVNTNITLYGIKNCDTVKKARKWLDSNDIVYRFHDLRVDGLPPKQLHVWEKALGWESMLNKRSTTWKQLPEECKRSLNTQRALALIKEHPTLIKRPLLAIGERYRLGFTIQDYQEYFSK